MRRSAVGVCVLTSSPSPVLISVRLIRRRGDPGKAPKLDESLPQDRALPFSQTDSQTTRPSFADFGIRSTTAVGNSAAESLLRIRRELGSMKTLPGEEGRRQAAKIEYPTERDRIWAEAQEVNRAFGSDNEENAETIITPATETQGEPSTPILEREAKEKKLAMEEANVRRTALLRDRAFKDVDEILRGDKEKQLRFVSLVPSLDPSSSERNKQRILEIEELRETAASSGKDPEEAVLDAVANMDDETLLAYIKAGAIDPSTLGYEKLLAEEDGADVVGEAATAIDSELLQAKQLSEITRLLADDLDGKPDEAVCELLAKANIGDFSEFTEEDIRMLEEFEKSEKECYTTVPNRVLRLAAEIDPKIKESLVVLDRTRRKAILDAEFEAAIRYSRQADKLVMEKVKPLPKPVMPDVTQMYYASGKFTQVPPRGRSGVPDKPLPSKQEKLRIAADGRRIRKGSFYRSKERPDALPRGVTSDTFSPGKGPERRQAESPKQPFV